MYCTRNEFEHFDYKEGVIEEISRMNGNLCIWLQNVKILPENSCNRDIRIMRTNDLAMKFTDAVIESVTKEGYKRYNADGVLLESIEDEVICEDHYEDVFAQMVEGSIFSFEKDGQKYALNVDTEEYGSFDIQFSAANCEEEWERFLNL